MALGDSYNNNRQDNVRPTVYGYSLYNITSERNKSRISFSMWQRTIKISIENMIREAQGSQMAEYDNKNASVIYLTSAKALMLASILEKYQKDPEAYSGYGIASARALLTIFREDDEDIIRIDALGNSGTVAEGSEYVINKLHSVVSSVNNKGIAYDDESMSGLDFEQMIYQLRDYGRFANNSISFTVLDTLSYNANTNNSFIKVALERIKSGDSGNHGGVNYGKSAPTKSSSIEDLNDFVF